MATVSREIVNRLIAGNGRLPDDQEDAPDNPRAVRIVGYVDQGGRNAYGVVFDGERDPNRYERESEFVQRPWVIWTWPDGVRADPDEPPGRVTTH